MSERIFRLRGAGLDGSKISAALLVDLLEMVIHGSRRALRMRIEGRSAAAGAKPPWLEPASSFAFLGLGDGSCVVHVDAPSLAEAAPSEFLQKSFFVDNERSGIDFWEDSLRDASAGRDESELFDPGMLSEFERDLAQLFSHSVSSLESGKADELAPSLVVGQDALQEIRRLQAKTPMDRIVQVAGNLDMIRHSDRKLRVTLRSGRTVTCVAGDIRHRSLVSLWGKDVLVQGKAVYRPSGSILRIEADHIEPATEANLELWSEIPEPFGAEIDTKSLRIPQGPRSGINALYDGWPGEETDEEMAAILEEIS